MDGNIEVFQFTYDAELKSRLRHAADRVLNSKRFILGEEVRAFESEFANYCDASHCVGVANGTDALELALRGLGVGTGSRVATVANAGYYASTAIAALGARPVYIDVDETSLTMSPGELSKEINNVQAVVATHLYGRLAEIEEIVRIANAHKVPVIEDCAQAHGARRGGRLAGTFGAAGCFSFYPTKNLGALGDGGAIVTSDIELASAISALRQYGWDQKYRISVIGGRNSRLDELQAAFLRVQLPYLDINNAKRLCIASAMREKLKPFPLLLPAWTLNDYVAHLFVVRTDSRTEFRAHLLGAGIKTEIHYPTPDHRQPALGRAFQEIDLPVTQLASQQVTTLPCFPGMGEQEINRVVAAVASFY